MNILILGSGGREHTLAWKIIQSPLCDNLFVAPGNAGTGSLATNLQLDIMNFREVEEVVRKNKIDWLIVGPEAPLVNGISDHFAENMPDVLVVGPKKEGAQLEGSKAFAKAFMAENNIPTAAYLEVTEDNLEEGIAHLLNTKGPYVLKADGLAAGKGVLIVDDASEAVEQLKQMIGGMFGRASATVVIEEFLEGIEFSAFILTDGQYYSLLPMAKDYKRIGEGDTGLNTGGMGAISPVSFVDDDLFSKVKQRIIIPTLAGLHRRGIDYLGFIFFGLINVGGDPYVIEYNCRLGDPETQVVLPRMQNDFPELIEALYNKKLYEVPLIEDPRYAAAVVMVSGGYPGTYEKGKLISGLQDAGDSYVFQAGTKRVNEELMTNGGRVLAVTSLADTKSAAVALSIQNANLIQFDGKYFRKDIGFDL